MVVKRIRSFALESAAAAALFGFAAASLSPAAAAESAGTPALASSREEPRIGAVAPGFSLTGMDGSGYSLAGFRGKPVVLNFWASWCGPCRDEAPLLAKLHKQYGSDLQIVAVNLTDVDSEKDAREFAATYGFDFPVLLDKNGNAADSYRIRPIPTTFFIDAKGVIQDGALGALTWEELDKRAERLLKQD